MYSMSSYPRYYQRYRRIASAAAGLYNAASYGEKYYRAKRAVNAQIVKQAGKPIRRRYRRRRYNRTYTKQLPRIKKDIAVLKKQVKSNTSTYIKKFRTFGTSLSAANNQCDYHEVGMNSVSILQDVIDSVKYFDPSTPGTLINVDLSAPTFQNQVNFVKSYCKVLARANYSVPTRLTLYICECKKDTSIAPATAISNSLTDFSNAASTSPLVYPTDCHDFNDLWKIVASKRCVLQPGQEVSLSHSFKPFMYDVSLADSQSDSYQTYFHGSIMLIRVEGVTAHGSTSGTAQAQGGVDLEVERQHVVKYPGGADIVYMEVDDNPNTIVGTIQLTNVDILQTTYGL